MNIRLTFAGISAAWLLPIMASADGLTLSGGVAATAAFDTANGLSHSENTVEGYIEGELNGVHAGVWIGSLFDDPTDDAEYELSLGYGGNISDTLGYDITATRYYLNNGGYQSYDIAFELSAVLNGRTNGALEVTWDREAETIETTIGLEYALTDKFTLAGEIGRSEADNNMFGEIGISYDLTEKTALELL